MKTIYLDNNATSQVAPEVKEAMLPFLDSRYGNPSSIHRFGGLIKKDIDRSREQIAQMINAEPDEIIFTSCGTESNNTAFLSALENQEKGKTIITSKVEHPAVLNPAEYYSKKGFMAEYLEVDEKGLLDMVKLKEKLTEDTAFVSVMFANNETGVFFPVKEIGEMCAEKNILFHCDAVQGAGKAKIDVKELNVDYLSLSGHKFHAPKGVGILYVKNQSPFSPLLIGGHQEKGRRGGTEAVANIAAIGKAAELAMLQKEEEKIRVREMRDYLEESILKEIRKSFVNGCKENRLYNTTNISFEGIEGEAILLLLDEKGICASSGSACTTGSLEPSHVLRAMNVPYTLIHSSIRFSLSHYNTMDEMRKTVEALKETVAYLRDLSPFWKEPS